MDAGAFKIKGRVNTPKGEISLVAVISSMSDSLQLVDIHRGKGERAHSSCAGVFGTISTLHCRIARIIHWTNLRSSSMLFAYSGDILEYNVLYTKLREQLADLVSKGST